MANPSFPGNGPGSASSGRAAGMLPEISVSQAFKRKVFVKIRPVQAEWRNFDVVELLRGASGQSLILTDRKSDFNSLIHFNHYKAVFIKGFY
jgi:hypothetical protein